MIKVQVKNGVDYRTVDPFRGTIEYIEDHLGNRYAFNSDQTTLDDVYALFDNEEFLNEMISKIPAEINTIMAQYLDIGGTKYDANRVVVTTNSPITIGSNIDVNVYNAVINFRTRFTTSPTPHSSWPVESMNSREGILIQEEAQNGMLIQQIVTDVGDVIIRIKKADGTWAPWKSLFSGSNKTIRLGNWNIRENEDGSLGFFNKE